MKTKNIITCNVCFKTDKDEPKTLFLKATKTGEDVDVCTACIPSIIHGSGDIVKSNKEVMEKVNLL
ncbi:MAG: hypothetical protein JJV94_04460 [Sulfurospirillum sp.]|nr:hypothetical protein [Sulfurospirillum sp.]